MSVARNGSIELAYDVEGDGPDLLLIAGSASTRPLWQLVRPALARRFRTIAFDNRDSGESTIATAPYALADLAADALAVLDAAGARRPHVLGHSMGGAVAQELALRHPQRCATLTLACTWARGDGYSRSVMELLATLTRELPTDRALLASILFAGSAPEPLRAMGLFDRTDAAMALGPLAPREALLRQWALDLEVDTLDRLPHLDLPVHVIASRNDRLLPPPASQQLAAAIRGALLTELDGCGHLPMVDAPDAFSAAALAFLSDHAVPAEGA